MNKKILGSILILVIIISSGIFVTSYVGNEEAIEYYDSGRIKARTSQMLFDKHGDEIIYYDNENSTIKSVSKYEDGVYGIR